ncbi:FixH family protein [Vibrio sp. Of7-15]|uniref:FixH family protein n=1 Tax=Vibrio sp. Of7-15 TaxID=2724879 RepID=UPI001EF23719|nr:FixH family protein [Vibrio sp. Of7-15]MCG7496339.1 FixH family protein [Vibrio sp. Of7-15]
MSKPWYKQFWPWFIIALPMSAVIAGFTTLTLFTKNQVSLVAEDYYKKGKGINIDLSRLKAAKELGLEASIHSEGSNLLLSFTKGKLETYPSLRVLFTHRTLADKDFSQMLTADANGNYRLSLDKSLDGPWFVELESFDKQWMLQGRVNFPTSEPVELDGQN